MTITIHAAVPLCFIAAGLLGTIGKWLQACWPLVLAGGIVWAIVGAM